MQDTAETGRKPGRAPLPPRRRMLADTRGESLGALIAQLAHALLARACARLPLVLVNRIITCCALVALVSPLLLWFSWSKAGFFPVPDTGWRKTKAFTSLLACPASARGDRNVAA